MNRDDRGTLLGLVFGDGHIAAPKGSSTATLVVKHGIKQLEYVRFKAALVGNLLGGICPNVRLIDNSGFPGCIFTKTNRYLRVLRNWLYVDGRKTLSPYIRWLNPEGLAIWYMDDGGLGRHKRNGVVNAVRLYINCHTSLDEAQNICDEIDSRFGIRFIPGKNNGKYRISCGTREARRFGQIIAPFMHGSMMYKLAIPESPRAPDATALAKI